MDPDRRAVVSAIKRFNRQLRDSSRQALRILKWPDDIGAGAADYGQSVINRAADTCDVLICLIGPRLGTPTPRANAGTEEESDRAVERVYRGFPVQVLVFFSNLPTRLSQIDPYQFLLVKGFREKAARLGVLYHNYDTLNELETRARTSIRAAYRNVVMQKSQNKLVRAVSAAAKHKPQRGTGHRSIQLTNKLAPQQAHVLPIAISEYRGRDIVITGTITARSPYFRVGFKYSDSREPPVSPGSVLTQGQNLLLHAGKNTDSSAWFFTFYRAGLRLEPNRAIAGASNAHPQPFELSITKAGYVHFEVARIAVFDGFFQVDGIPSLWLMGWGDEHRFECRVTDLRVTAMG